MGETFDCMRPPPGPAAKSIDRENYVERMKKKLYQQFERDPGKFMQSFRNMDPEAARLFLEEQRDLLPWVGTFRGPAFPRHTPIGVPQKRLPSELVYPELRGGLYESSSWDEGQQEILSNELTQILRMRAEETARDDGSQQQIAFASRILSIANQIDEAAPHLADRLTRFAIHHPRLHSSSNSSE